MKKLLICFSLSGALFAPDFAFAQSPILPGYNTYDPPGVAHWQPIDKNNPLPVGGGILNHVASTTLVSSQVVKTTSGNLGGFNCTAITGGAAGFCVAIAANSAPTNGATITPLDFCWFDTTARGCSLSRIPSTIAYSNGITILITSAATPYTFTSGTDTAAVSADFN